MDNKLKTGKVDDDRINVNENYELQYWSEKLNVNRDQIKEAVKAAGPLVTEIEKYLKQKK